MGSVMFFAAVAVAGMPPLSGFIGKTMILHAALESPLTAAVYAVLLGGGFMIIVALARSGSMLFYRTIDSQEMEGDPINKRALVAVLGLLAISPLMVLFAHPVGQFTEAMATQLFETAGYINAVLTTPTVGGAE